MTGTRMAWRGLGTLLVAAAFLLAAAHASSDGDRPRDGAQDNQDQDGKGKGKGKGKGQDKGKDAKSDPNIVTVDLSKLPKDLAKELKRYLDREEAKKKAEPSSSNTRDLERRLDALARELEALRKDLRSQGDAPKKKKKD